LYLSIVKKKLEYVVLPTREVLSKYPDDTALSIHKAEQSSFWRDKKKKQFLQAEGTQFFKRNADALDTSFSMEDSNGKMSAGFFLYLAYRRFQNQQVQAHFINDDEADNLLKPDAERGINIVEAPKLDDEGQGIIGGEIDAKAFIAKMRSQGFRQIVG